MTDVTMTRRTAFPTSSRTRWWRRRTTGAALVAALAVATVLGPPLAPATRLGAGEVVGFSTVSAADTIISADVLAEVPAAQ